jgi:hypothetical protein
MIPGWLMSSRDHSSAGIHPNASHQSKWNCPFPMSYRLERQTCGRYRSHRQDVKPVVNGNRRGSSATSAPSRFEAESPRKSHSRRRSCHRSAARTPPWCLDRMADRFPNALVHTRRLTCSFLSLSDSAVYHQPKSAKRLTSVLPIFMML